MLSRVATLLSFVMAGGSVALIVNFLRLDWKRGRTHGFWVSLFGSLFYINITIFALLFGTGIKFRPSGGDEVGANTIITAWPRMFILLPLLIVFFTLVAWLMEPFTDSNRHG
jgi:hypothetical protein